MTTLHLRGSLDQGAPLTAQNHDDNMLRLYGFATLADLMADEDRGYAFYAAGATIATLAEGYRYEVAASDAEDHHLETASGLKLYVQPADDGSFNFGAFNPAGDDETDDFEVFRLAFNVAAGRTLRIPAKTYFLSSVLQVKLRIKVIGYGARLRWPAGVDGIINHHLWSWGQTAINRRNVTAAGILTHYAGLVTHDGNVYGAAPGQSSGNLGAEEPGTGSRWRLIREIEERDSPLPVWSGPGTYSIINSNPSDGTNHYFLVGSYVTNAIGETIYYLVADPEAVDHDAETMFGVKLYNVEPEDYPSWSSAGGSLYEGITLDGTSVDADRADGIWLRVGAFLRNVTIENFSRYGARVEAAVPGEAPGSPMNWGNVNAFSIENLIANRNGDTGLYVRGSDANGGVILGGEFSFNGRIGIWDNSFLGNTYVGCRTEGNGIGISAGNSGGRSSVVSHGGKLYQAVYVPMAPVSHMSTTQLALLVSTTPGTNPAVWEEIGEGAPSDEHPAWQSGQDAGFYFLGSGIVAINGNARTLVSGCSTGTLEAGNIFSGGYITVLGGNMPRIARGSQIVAADGGHLRLPSIEVRRGGWSVSRRILMLPDANTLMSFHSVGSSNGFGLRSFDDDIFFSYPGPGTNVAAKVSGADTSQAFGTSAPIPHVWSFPNGFALGDRRHLSGTAAPGTGEHARGEVVFNQNPSAGGHLGWICTESGTPGVWKAMGTIAS